MCKLLQSDQHLGKQFFPSLGPILPEFREISLSRAVFSPFFLKNCPNYEFFEENLSILPKS